MLCSYACRVNAGGRSKNLGANCNTLFLSASFLFWKNLGGEGWPPQPPTLSGTPVMPSRWRRDWSWTRSPRCINFCTNFDDSRHMTTIGSFVATFSLYWIPYGRSVMSKSQILTLLENLAAFRFLYSTFRINFCMTFDESRHMTAKGSVVATFSLYWIPYGRSVMSKN